MSTAKRIGGDWVENIDSNTGKKYYANLKTKVTTWHYPAELTGEKIETSPADWVERQDPKSGRVYYYNPKTKDTTWVKPTENVADAIAELDDEEQWTERVDPKSGRKYYVNAVTRRTTWTNPHAGAGGGIAEEPFYKPAPAEPISKARKSMRLGAAQLEKPMPVSYSSETFEDRSSVKKSNRFSFRRSAQSRKSSGSSYASEEEEPSDITGSMFGGFGNPNPSDRFAKLRALRNKRDGVMATEEHVVGKQLANVGLEEAEFEEEEPSRYDQGAQEADNQDAGIAYIDYLPFIKYATEHFRKKKKKAFMSKSIPIEKQVSWGKEPLKQSLHELSESVMRQDAVQMFKNILSYMGDRDSSKKGLNHCQKILANALHAPEELRDEVYCQLIKQTTNNPGLSSCVRGWQLMSICAGTFPPSKKLERYLMSYCFENSTPSPQDPSMRPYPEIQPYAHYALLRLSRTVTLGPRRHVPIAAEINAAKERQPVVQRVHILSRESKTIPVEAWTTVGQMSAMMAKKLGVIDPTPFAIFEYNSREEERVIDEDERVLDVLAQWKEEHDQSNRKKNPLTYTFVYKMRLFFDIPDNDTAAVDLAYIQAVHDVTDSRYPCSEQDCITLAALQAQERYGDYNKGGSVFQDNFAEYVPEKFIRPGHESDLERAINKVYAKLGGYTADEAKANYIDYVKSWKIYGSVYFVVYPQNSREFPDEVILAVNAKGVLIVDPDSKDFLAEYPYSEVVTWGHSAATFVLVIGNLIRSSKVYFKTDQGAEVNSLVHAYVNRLLDTK